MRLLLDTQIALWWLVGSARLKRAARERIASAECFVSAASVWEVAIKYRLGKLSVAPEIFASEMHDGGANILPVDDGQAAAYARLPAGHGDPFDLLLLAVAQTERLQFLTADAALRRFAQTMCGLPVLAP